MIFIWVKLASKGKYKTRVGETEVGMLKQGVGLARVLEYLTLARSWQN